MPTPPPPVGRGKPGPYTTLAVHTCLTLKTLFRLPYRATEGLMKSLMRLKARPAGARPHPHVARRAAQLFSRTFERQVAEAHVRAAIFNRFTYPGIPRSVRAGQIAPAA